VGAWRAADEKMNIKETLVREERGGMGERGRSDYGCYW